MRKCKTLDELATNAAALGCLVDRGREIDSVVDVKENITREDVELALLHLEHEEVLECDWQDGRVLWIATGKEVLDKPLRGFAAGLRAPYRDELRRKP